MLHLYEPAWGTTSCQLILYQSVSRAATTAIRTHLRIRQVDRSITRGRLDRGGQTVLRHRKTFDSLPGEVAKSLVWPTAAVVVGMICQSSNHTQNLPAASSGIHSPADSWLKCNRTDTARVHFYGTGSSRCRSYSAKGCRDGRLQRSFYVASGAIQ